MSTSLRCLSWITPLLQAGLWMVRCTADEDLRTWHPSPSFPERVFTGLVEPQVRFHINAPLGDKEARRATRIVIYTCPNGNTIEQTLGAQMSDGCDWHHDIQHVAAQIRLLRSLQPNGRIVPICVETEKLNWPQWRQTVPDANTTIGRMIDTWMRSFGTDDCRVTITGQSGGGSFALGMIESVDRLPEYVDRFVFLEWTDPRFDAGNAPQIAGTQESVGINRLGVGNERVLQRRLCQSRWPRVLR